MGGRRGHEIHMFSTEPALGHICSHKLTRAETKKMSMSKDRMCSSEARSEIHMLLKKGLRRDVYASTARPGLGHICCHEWALFSFIVYDFGMSVNCIFLIFSRFDIVTNDRF